VTDYTPPCAQPENDPQDWFIEKDGRQYEDEPIFTADEVRAIWDAEYARGDDADPEGALQRATEERLAENIRKRRHAKDKCFTECAMRTLCLQRGMDEHFTIQRYGIWGGYYPEELRAIQRRGRANRKAQDQE